MMTTEDPFMVLLTEDIQLELPGHLRYNEEEAQKIVEEWESAWPEIVDFMRKKAAQIDHRITIRIEERRP